ncbi:ATP-binding protein [Psychrobacillus sp. NPDC058041]|uniref:ATP-binding protein n=1 Tax=Psychrobacillus sp. NPDC058041 TaxID=3346310 RepID=UPI0036DC277A
MLETFLVNILFLVLPILLIVVFFDNKKKNDQLVILFFFAASMILCMVYPIKLELGFLFDLRYVPYIIVGLYGGYKGLFPLFLILNVYRIFLGGNGTFNSFATSTVIFILLPLMTKRFNGYNTKMRIITGVSAAVFIMIIYLLLLSSYFEVLNEEYWTLTFYAITTHGIVIAIDLIMIEKIIANIKNRENFLQAEQFHVISELSASVSHEIRNPLTVTKGFLQLLNVSKTVQDEDKVYLDYSLKELIRAENILNDYLAFAKPQSEHMVQSNFKKEFEYVKNVLLPLANLNNVEISYHFSNTLKKKFDQNQLKQCLINLLKNAIEAMKEDGGNLVIEVTDQGKNIVIRIQDTGIGMSKEEILQLGKPYYSNKKEGTGLGMMMVYGTIGKMKGRIDVQSKKGEGTTFTITIPT